MGALRASDGLARRPLLILLALAALAVLVLLKSGTVIVPAGHRGVIFSQSEGVREGTLDEGLHLIVPIIWEVRLYDVRSLTFTVGAEPRLGEIPGGEAVDALSSDGQQMSLHLSLRYHVDPDKTWRIHRDVGEDYLAKIIKPELRSEARMAVAAYPGADVYSKERYNLQQKIEDRLRKRLVAEDVVVEKVLLRDIIFSPQFQNAIEQKQIAQQESMRMEYVVKKQEEEKKQAIILAQGEAQAIRLKGQALTSYPELVQWEYVSGLPPNLDVVVTDAQTIINLGDLLQAKAPAATTPPASR
jgi:regulator of protease activity HflC (stomatin/prohibitin superfamily)